MSWAGLPIVDELITRDLYTLRRYFSGAESKIVGLKAQASTTNYRTTGPSFLVSSRWEFLMTRRTPPGVRDTI